MSDINIHLHKSDPETWVLRDFATYFYNKAEAFNGDYGVERNYPRDCPIIKQMIVVFKENSRPQVSVSHFLEWSFTYFSDNNYPMPITIPTVRTFVPTFLQIPRVKQKKVYNHIEKVWASAKQREWLREQKKAYGTANLPKPEVRTRKRRSKRSKKSE